MCQISKSCFLALAFSYLSLLSKACCLVFFSISCVLMVSEELARCTNPHPGGPGEFCSRCSSSSPWYFNTKLPGHSASFGPPRVFYFPSAHHIWCVFPYLPPGEAPDGRLATSHERIEQILIKNNYNSSTLYTITWDMSYASAGQDHIVSYVVKNVSLHNPENINNLESVPEESHYCMVLLFQQYRLYWLSFVI